MDLREGQNITRPPLLEGNKYGYWRVRMKAFLKYQDESVWGAVENGWTHPVISEAGKVSLLTKDKWTEVHKNAEAANSKAMSAIFSGVDGKHFMMISTCEIAKKAWDILQTDNSLVVRANCTNKFIKSATRDYWVEVVSRGRTQGN
ncbi:unnamed protein product [Rhodiola kirilowii]